jgi:anti-sigma factor RsiW
VTGDEAREHFSEAVEGELSPDERRAFDAALAGDPALREEFARFEGAVRGAKALGSVPPPPVDLVPGVQRKLRTRSRGRYYRDRFASRTPRLAHAPLWIAAASLLALVGAWLLYYWLLP